MDHLVGAHYVLGSLVSFIWSISINSHTTAIQQFLLSPFDKEEACTKLYS